MIKINRLIAVACVAMLCSPLTYAQQYSLSIEEMFSLADKNSTSIRSFNTGKDEADAALAAAKAERLPDVNAQLSFSYLGNGYIWDRDFSNGKNIEMPHFGNNFVLKASQAIYTGGALTSGINLAKMGRKMAELNGVENRNNVRFMLIGYYLQIFQLKNHEQVLTKNIELTEQVVMQMQARQNVGTVLRNDITRYELQLENLKLQRTRAVNNRKIINHQLVTVIGLPATAVIEPDSSVINRQMSMLAESDWQNSASVQSVSLQKASLGVDMSREKEKIERAERLPKIAIVAEEHFDGPITIEVPTLNNNFNYWFVGVGVSYNISSLFKNNKKIKEAEIATRHAQEQLTLVKEGVENGVQAAYTNYLTSFTDLETQNKSVELANQNYEVVNNRYENELALVTDMIDASNAKLSAELAQVNSRINVIYNYYNMLYVSGQLSK